MPRGRKPIYRDQYPELWDEAWLWHRYIDLDMGQTEIAEELGFDCPAWAVDTALKRFCIPRRGRHSDVERIYRQKRLSK